MPIPSSQHRLTRSQVRLGRAELSFSSPAPDVSSPPCNLLAPADAQTGHKACTTAERGRRKALAELAGNDSPVVGLIPGLRDSITCRTPFSEIKSAMSMQSCIKKPSILLDESSDTPLGERLLRSQVQLLLQKVEENAPSNHKPAASLRALCHLHSITDSPALKIAAPTPINTPCNIPVPSSDHLQDFTVPLTENTMSVQTSVTKSSKTDPVEDLRADHGKLLVQRPSDTISPYKLLGQDKATVLGVHASGINLRVDLKISPEVEAVEPPQHLRALPTNSEIGHVTITNSVVSGRDHHIMHTSPLISKVLNEAETEILGKMTTRVLQFDSPDKSLTTEASSATVVSLCDSFTSLRELEDDEASQWSLIVNVSSPESKHEEVDGCGGDYADSVHSFCGEDSSVHEHVQKNRIGNNKSERLWSMPRKGTPFRRAAIIEDEDEEAGSEEELATEQCQNLFKDLTVKEDRGKTK